jgi:hypothetical protein
MTNMLVPITTGLAIAGIALLLNIYIVRPLVTNRPCAPAVMKDPVFGAIAVAAAGLSLMAAGYMFAAGSN